MKLAVAGASPVICPGCLMLLLLVDFFKLVLLAGLLMAIWHLSLTRLLMPKIFWLIAVFVQLAFLLLLHGIEFVSFVVLLLYVGAISVLFLFVVMILNPDAKPAATVAPASTLATALPSWLGRYYFASTPSLVALFLSLLVAETFALEFFAYLQGLWAQLWPFLVAHELVVVAPTTVLPQPAVTVFYDYAVCRNLASPELYADFLKTYITPAVTGQITPTLGWGAVPVAGLAPTSDLWFIAESFYTQDFVLFWLVGLILLVAMVGAILLTLQKSRGLKRQKGTTQSKRYHEYERHAEDNIYY